MEIQLDEVSNDPIRHVVVLGHPAAASFNRSVADAYCETVRECGQEAVLRDLYAIGFDPLLKAEEQPGSPGAMPGPDIQDELYLLSSAAIVTLIYPIWFGMPPAIIKGYVDRVLGSGFVPGDIKTGPTSSVVRGKRLMLFSSSASTRAWLEEQGQWLGLRQVFETYLATLFAMNAAGHTHFDSIAEGLKPRFVEENLATVREKTRQVCAAMLSERRRAQAHSVIHPG